MSVSRTTLKLLAMLTWITGGMVLFFKGYALVAEALSLRPEAALSYLPFPIAMVIGSIKARYIFLPSCRKNLVRIASLVDAKVWQFFRPGFFLFLLAMISLGAWLSRWASGNYGALVTVASVDLTLSVALFGSLGGFRAQELPGTGEMEKRGGGEYTSTRYPGEKNV